MASEFDEAKANEAAEMIHAFVNRYVLEHDRAAAVSDIGKIVDVVSKHTAFMVVDEAIKTFKELVR